MIVFKAIAVLVTVFGLAACGGGSSSSNDQLSASAPNADCPDVSVATVMISGGCPDADNQESDDDNTDGEQTPDDNTVDSNDSVIGTTVLAEGFSFTGTGGAEIESISVVASNGEKIAFTAVYSTFEGDSVSLWVGDVDTPLPVLMSGTQLPIPSEENQFSKASSLRYFDDGTLGVFFDRIGGEAGFMTIDESNAFVVAATGVTLQGVLEPRLVDQIGRASHSGSRNIFVGWTEDIGNSVLWQVDGTDTTAIASTYNIGISSKFTEDSCGITLLGRDFSLNTANGALPNIGLTESGDTLFMARLSAEFSGCNQEGLAIVRYSDGVYTRLVSAPETTTGTSLSLRDVFPDGSFIFQQSGRLMMHTLNGDVTDVDPSLLPFSTLDFEELNITAEDWANRPDSLPSDAEFSVSNIAASGVDGSVIFEANIPGQGDEKLSSPALWIYNSSREVVRLAADEDLLMFQGEGKRIDAVVGYDVEYYEPNNFLLVRVRIGDVIGNPGQDFALLKIDLQ